jgi:branched-chain amino acid transport system permease protein
MTDLLQLVVEGLLLGGIYALLSLGLNLIFGVTRIVVFLYGELLMILMYGGFVFWRATGWDPYLALPALVVAATVIGVALYETLFRRLVRAGHLPQILATLGLSFTLQNVALLLWTADVQSVRSAVIGHSVGVAGVHISTPSLIAFVVGLAASGALLQFLARSHSGLAMRAIAQDRTAAELVGIPLDRIYRLTLVLSTVLVAVSATFMLPVFTVFPTVGLDFVLLAFVVVVLGGMGSVGGGIVASFVVSLVQSFSGYYIGIQWQNVVYFTLFVLALLVRPAGLAGVRGTEQLGE